jgi:hypothetical protein
MRVVMVLFCILASAFLKDMPEAEQSKSNKGVSTVIQEATGDLDKDGIPERVEIVNGRFRKDTGAIREIRIFKKSNNGWSLWHKSIGAVLSEGESRPGEDPFTGLRIERGCIVLEHGFDAHGGPYTHRYRYQHDDWYLIGVTNTYAMPCNERLGYDQSEKYDFNVPTKSLYVEYKHASCEDADNKIPAPKNMPHDTAFTLKISKFHNIRMDGYGLLSHKIEIPGFDSKEFFF